MTHFYPNFEPESVSQPQRLDAELSTGQTLLLIGLAALTALLLGVLPFAGIINYPFRLLITMVHELGHGLAALLTGGRFLSFEVAPGGSGLAYTAGGWRLLIIPAGYLSVAVFAAVLILFGRSYRWSRRLMLVIGLAVLGLSLLFARPGGFAPAQLVSGILTFVAGVTFGAIFLWLALRASARWLIFSIHFVAIKAALTAFSDLYYLLAVSSGLDASHSDAANMAQVTGIPALLWALLWIVMAGFLIGGAVWLTWLKRG